MLSWIISSLSESVLPHIVGLNTAAEVWTSFSLAYWSPSRAGVLQLRLQLQTLKKGGSSINEFFQRAKSLADCLATISNPVSSNDHLLYVLANLGSEYEAFITAITTRLDVDTLSLGDVHSMLLSHEIWLQHHHQPPPLDGPSPAANIARVDGKQ